MVAGGRLGGERQPRMVSWPIMDTVSGGSKRKFMPSTVEKIMKQDYKRCEKTKYVIYK